MATQSKKSLFGTDGIRGVAGVDLTPDLAVRVGQAIGLQLRSAGHKRPNVIVGKDTRLSGYMIEDAIVAGLVSMGAHVLQVGPIPTPGLALLTKSMRMDMGVMITASHNPFGDNGIKLVGPDGYKLDDPTERGIEHLVQSDMSAASAHGAGIGRAKRVDDALGRYIEFVKNTVPSLKLDGMRTVIDCANGAGYKTAVAVLHELGAELFKIGVSPDGTNINDGCGSTHPQAAIEEVLKYRADVGIVLDGDADRVQIVDEKGNLIDGDQMLAAIATDWHATGRLAKPVVVGTVMSNLGFERYLGTLGISLVRAKVGDRYVLEQMRQYNAALGGEPSGHVILADYATTGDGLMAALQVLAVVKKSGRPISEALHLFKSTPQTLKNIRFTGGSPLESASVKRAIEEAGQRLGAEGRILVRPSGTEPLIRVMAEGEDKAAVEAAVDSIVAAIKSSQDQS